MQFGQSYIGRWFAITQPLDLPGAGVVLAPGTVGHMDAFDANKASLRLEFRLESGRMVKAWVDDARLALANAPEWSKPKISEEPKDAVFPDWVTRYGAGLIPVESSNVKAVGFFELDGSKDIADGEEPEGDIVVAYKNGGGYVFKKRDRETFAGLLKSPSVGRYMAKNVVNGEKL